MIIGVTQFWHRRYALIFGLTRFGINDPWPQLSCVGGQQKVRRCYAITYVCALITLWYNDPADVVPPATQVKNRRKTVSTEEKLDVISRIERCDLTVDICLNVRFARIYVHTTRYNADTITESSQSGNNVFVFSIITGLWDWTKNCACEVLTFLVCQT